MKILIACEYSGTVREAFRKKGHDAVSCDIIDTEIPGPHYKGNVLDIINDGWDRLIGFPPCTYISYAGMQHWNTPGRLEKRLEALQFFGKLWTANINEICLENPRGCASPTIAKYSQEIQPYYFGDPQIKTTWLWLKNLPKLKYSIEDTLFEDKTATRKPEPHKRHIRKCGKKRNYYYVDKIRDPKERARFWPAIAAAMAEQWG